MPQTSRASAIELIARCKPAVLCGEAVSGAFGAAFDRPGRS